MSRQWAAQSNYVQAEDPAAGLLMAAGAGQFASTFESMREALARATEHATTKLILHGEARPNHVAFSSDGQWLVAGGLESTIFLWNAKDGRLVAEFSPLQHWIDIVAVSQGGNQVAIYANGGPGPADLTPGAGRVLIWDRSTNKVIAELDSSGSVAGKGDQVDSLPVDAMQFANSGREIAFASGHQVFVWNIGEARFVGRVDLSRGFRARALAFSRDDGKLVVASHASEDRRSLIQVADWRRNSIRTVHGIEDEIEHVVASPNSDHIYAVAIERSSSNKPGAAVYSVSTGSAIAEPQGPLGTNLGDTSAIGWASSPDDDSDLQCANASGTFIVLTHCRIDDDSRRRRVSINSNNNSDRAAGGYLVSAAWDGRSVAEMLASPASQARASSTGEHGADLSAIAGGGLLLGSRDRTTVVQIVSGRESSAVTVWHIRGGALTKGATQAIDGEVTVSDLSPDGKLLALGGNTLQIIELPKLNVLRLVDPSPGPFTSGDWIVFAPDTKSLVVSSYSVSQIDWRTGGVIRRFGDESKPVAMLGSMGRRQHGYVRFNPDGNMLLVGRTLWDVGRQDVVANLTESDMLQMSVRARQATPSNRVVGLAFSEDSRFLLSSSDIETIAVPIQGEPLARELCRKANRRMTAAEWQRYAPGIKPWNVCQ